MEAAAADTDREMDRQTTGHADGERAPGDPPESAIIAAAVDGDAEACALLVRTHLRKAMAVALEFMKTREDAEDVVQDAFRAAFASLGRFDRTRPFAPWFFTILRNTARNALDSRRVRAHDPLSPAYAAAGESPLESAHRRELRRAIEDAVESLPPAQRTCFRLCLIEGLTSREAASATGVAESTVRVHIFRARNTLRELLDRWRDEVE